MQVAANCLTQQVVSHTCFDPSGLAGLTAYAPVSLKRLVWGVAHRCLVCLGFTHSCCCVVRWGSTLRTAAVVCSAMPAKCAQHKVFCSCKKSIALEVCVCGGGYSTEKVSVLCVCSVVTVLLLLEAGCNGLAACQRCCSSQQQVLNTPLMCRSESRFRFSRQQLFSLHSCPGAQHSTEHTSQRCPSPKQQEEGRNSNTVEECTQSTQEHSWPIGKAWTSMHSEHR